MLGGVNMSTLCLRTSHSLNAQMVMKLMELKFMNYLVHYQPWYWTQKVLRIEIVNLYIPSIACFGFILAMNL